VRDDANRPERAIDDSRAETDDERTAFTPPSAPVVRWSTPCVSQSARMIAVIERSHPPLTRT
jgi:hypothetical protein